MPKEKIFTESIILNAGHALIMPHKPEGIKMTQINEKLSAEPQDTHSLGLFDRATPNYSTYYPDVKAEDLMPSDDEFVEPVFRMLSNVTVHARFNPVYFPSDVLKKGMYKMVGQSVNIDHEMAVGNAIGAVKAVEWQNAYTADGIKVPAGFNAVLKIDGKSNPRIARGIMMDPPSIHANSVTVNFAWKPSHPNMEDSEFRNKLGQFDDKGKLIQKIATEIKAFHETSLVSHGADPFAQKINKEGKIVLPAYAGERYALAETSLSYHAWDWKNLEVGDFEEVILNSYDTAGTYSTDNNNNDQNSEHMKELLKFLETFLGLEVDSLTEENYQEKVGEIDFIALKAKAEADPAPVVVLDLTGVEAIENEITTLRAFKETVPEDLAAQIALAETGKIAVAELRADTERLYKLTLEDGKVDVNILAMITAADYKTLQSLHKQYDELTDKEFGFICTDCNSHNVTRASAKPATENKEVTNKSSQDTINHFTGVNKVVLSPWMKDKKSAE